MLSLVLGWFWVQYNDNGPDPIQIGPWGDPGGAFENLMKFDIFAVFVVVVHYSRSSFSLHGNQYIRNNFLDENDDEDVQDGGVGVRSRTAIGKTHMLSSVMHEKTFKSIFFFF